MKPTLVIARVRSPHGLKGEVKVESFSGESKHIKALKTAWLHIGDKKTEHKVISVRGMPETPIVLFEGISSPEEAATYRGAEVIVARAQANPLAGDEYYLADLVQCKVYFEGRQKGHVNAVWHNGICDMLEVECLDDDDNGRVAQLPLQDRFVSQVDVRNGRIELTVDWILE